MNLYKPVITNDFTNWVHYTMEQYYKIIHTSADINVLREICSICDGNIFSIDIEGINLGSDGRIRCVQIHRTDLMCVLIVDMFELNVDDKKIAVDILRGILEADNIVKFMFDPRNDALALNKEYGICPRNVLCMQLAEIAYRKQKNKDTRLRNGLAKILSTYRHLRVQNMDSNFLEVIKSYSIFPLEDPPTRFTIPIPSAKHLCLKKWLSTAP